MKSWLKRKLSIRQYELLRSLSYEIKRWKCRVTAPERFETDRVKLHLGCGDRHLEGWLNVDLVGSDLNLDIARGRLPFRDASFETIITQHVIEHLTIEDELIPLLKECHRAMKPSAELWLATPDMEKIARSYVEQKNTDMVEDRKTRLPHWGLGAMPSQQFMNDMFHQQSEHRNLFDMQLLEWTLRQAGFTHVERTSEKQMLQRFPDFPPRNDDYQSLYVKAVKP